MIPTYTFAIKQEILKTFLGNNLVVALVNQPSLGMTDTPSAQELDARASLTMNDIFSIEIGDLNLNGYARQIVDYNSIIVNQVNNELSNTELTVNFQALGGDFEPFTHLVLIKDADLTNADPLINGNNRTSTTGTIIYVEPVNNILDAGQPFTLENGLTFAYNFSLIVSSEVV